MNDTIWFLNREDGKVVGRLDSMGENGGQFFGLSLSIRKADLYG